MTTKREEIEARLDDAGIEYNEVFYNRFGDKGWHYSDAEGNHVLLGVKYHEAIASIDAMPNPNQEAPDPIPERWEGEISPETRPELFDEFGNPSKSPFGA